ncbi:porin [Siccirubricoccus deserti]|uniref:Porin n=1 Tax=Siccirubricoccus deserti TaxID=2013562 RepID=A0A9X0UCD6_9PROT|nr:porin [Siccirubricoccus deserti]MBC4014263.1 porin [Siccirubricoccus deserti]
MVGAALLAPAVAVAQQAPTVRVGGYFRAYFGYTQQTGQAPTNVSMNAQNGGANDANSAVGNTNQSARLGKTDISTDAEIHVFVNGKTANGLTYGAVVEMQFDSAEGSVRGGARRAVQSKTTAAIDEMYAFIASPTLGQIRFGDEDGPFGGLMNTGWVSNFGTGGVFGDFESFVTRPTRTGTTPGGVGDNSKIVYLSPQFFGFDVGVSYAPNEGEGEDTGCLNSFASTNCDRVTAITNPQGNGRSHDMPGRRNEVQWMARWRGSLAGVGLSASVGGMHSQVIKNIDLAGNINRNLRNPEVYQAGLQATYMGFTLGGGYMFGNTNFFYIPTLRGSKDMSQIFGGLSYTAGPVSIGANMYSGQYSGSDANPRGQRRWAYSIGANYRLAPGLDLVAEYVRQEFKEPGTPQQGFTAANAAPGNDLRDRASANVFLTGVRLAF